MDAMPRPDMLRTQGSVACALIGFLLPWITIGLPPTPPDRGILTTRSRNVRKPALLAL